MRRFTGVQSPPSRPLRRRPGSDTGKAKPPPQRFALCAASAALAARSGHGPRPFGAGGQMLARPAERQSRQRTTRLDHDRLSGPRRLQQASRQRKKRIASLVGAVPPAATINRQNSGALTTLWIATKPAMHSDLKAAMRRWPPSRHISSKYSVLKHANDRGGRPMPAAERMTITMPSEMAETLRRAVADGEYASTSELVREPKRFALRL